MKLNAKQHMDKAEELLKRSEDAGSLGNANYAHLWATQALVHLGLANTIAPPTNIVNLDNDYWLGNRETQR